MFINHDQIERDTLGEQDNWDFDAIDAMVAELEIEDILDEIEQEQDQRLARGEF